MTVGEDKPVSGTDIEGSIYQSKTSLKCPFISKVSIYQLADADRYFSDMLSISSEHYDDAFFLCYLKRFISCLT